MLSLSRRLVDRIPDPPCSIIGRDLSHDNFPGGSWTFFKLLWDFFSKLKFGTIHEEKTRN